METFNRRRFLKTSLTAVTTIGVAGAISDLGTNVLAKEEIAQLVVSKNGGPEANLRKAIDLLGGISKFVNKGQTVL